MEMEMVGPLMDERMEQMAITRGNMIHLGWSNTSLSGGRRLDRFQVYHLDFGLSFFGGDWCGGTGN
jgi:hypothetical protein